jgi:hypothetical protein
MDNGTLKRLYGMTEDEYQVLMNYWDQILEDIDIEEQGDPHTWEPTEEELDEMLETIQASKKEPNTAAKVVALMDTLEDMRMDGTIDYSTYSQLWDMVADIGEDLHMDINY